MRKIFFSMFMFMSIFLMVSCDSSNNIIDDLNPDKIVPKKDVLIENLTESGYLITTINTVEGSNLTIDRVMAKKGDKFIDIVYGLSDEEASKIFELYYTLYQSEYYILAINGNYVYCVSDKKTFKKAGFTSTTNIGIQYIND